MSSAIRTRIKVCGITRLEDALAASALGVDAVGFVFYKKSPRYITPMKAAAIIRELPPFVSAVGLFVTPEQSFIDEVLSLCPLGVIQLHGDESPEFCQAQARRVIKAIAVSCKEDLELAKQYTCSILLDTKAPSGVYGGTGYSFDDENDGNIEEDGYRNYTIGANVGSNLTEILRVEGSLRYSDSRNEFDASGGVGGDGDRVGHTRELQTSGTAYLSTFEGQLENSLTASHTM
ncbi:MAG: phosphoribosylanthranilate isomerase, partial [Mariprofundaceae bacterium]|nr:phosphoribosylanthranilate isomerase [Mariprofundaceae bacterium]